MHDCFAIELTGECLKCFIRLTRGVPAVVVQSEALWARIPEIQVRIPSRAMGTFFPHTVSSIFRLSLTHTHTHTHTHMLAPNIENRNKAKGDDGRSHRIIWAFHNIDTVKPVLSDHPTVQGKMVVIDRWSLKQGFPETDRFFEALLNSCEHCGTHTFDLRNDNSRQSGATGGLMRWFSRKLALW